MSDSNSEAIPAHMTWRNYQGHKYLYANYSFCSQVLIPSMLTEGTRYLKQNNDPGTLILINAEGTPINKRVMDAFLIASKANKPYFKKTATIGISPLKIQFMKLLKKNLNIDIHPFANQKDALEWLTMEGN